MATSKFAAPAAAQNSPRLGEAPVEEVIKAMTLEEKVHILVGTGMAVGRNSDPAAEATKALVPGVDGTTFPIERLGITTTVHADGPAGLRINPTREGDPATYYCTHFPCGTMLACSWDEELAEETGRAIGNEVLEYGVDVLLAPGVNIHRNPLCGRNYEYYSEDPVVAGKTAAAYVRGIQSNGVAVSLKHFAANSQESNRMASDSRVSPRALREIYLKGFEIAVKESDPWTVMSSYNFINGTYTSQSEELLTDVLRNDWGYEGMVESDWFGGNDPVAQVKAGNDLIMPGMDMQCDAILKAVQDGTLDEAVLDRNVKRVLEMIMKTPRFKGYRYSNKPDLEGHAAFARRSATEGMVLLKNEGDALPLGDTVREIALFGCTAYDLIAGGTGGGNVNHAYVVSLNKGLVNAGFALNGNLEGVYGEYAEKQASGEFGGWADPTNGFLAPPRPKEFVPTAETAAEIAAESDLAIITLGRQSGEFMDRSLQDFYLTDEEHALIETVCSAFHAAGKKAVVVLNIGGVIETASWKGLPDAILCAWQPGQEGGDSIADVLCGKANPSGKLTMSFPVRWEDAASSANFPTDARMPNLNMFDHGDGLPVERLWDYTDYEEDIYVGYRYFDSFGKEVSYPFGYGLSYTSFEYSDAKIAKDGDWYEVSVNVRNTGPTAGREVVQLYVSAPQSKLEKPEKELKAYAKTALLRPGESTEVKLRVKAADLASFDEEASAWVTDEGDYSFLVAASSRDVRCTLTAHADAATERMSNVLGLKTPLNRLTK